MPAFRYLVCLIALLLFVVGCGDSPTGEISGGAGTVEQEGDSSNKQSAGQRLPGTYVSDRAATIAFLESTGHYDADTLESLGSTFGNTEITYQGNGESTPLISAHFSSHSAQTRAMLAMSSRLRYFLSPAEPMRFMAYFSSDASSIPGNSIRMLFILASCSLSCANP